jgi:hypothetical protein
MRILVFLPRLITSTYKRGIKFGYSVRPSVGFLSHSYAIPHGLKCFFLTNLKKKFSSKTASKCLKTMF